MITDRDVKKLKEVFSTKDELNVVKEDVKVLKEDVKEIKKDIKKLDYSLSNLSKDVLLILEIVGENKQEFKPKIEEHVEMLENHERRLDKVEDKVFPTL